MFLIPGNTIEIRIISEISAVTFTRCAMLAGAWNLMCLST